MVILTCIVSALLIVMIIIIIRIMVMTVPKMPMVMTMIEIVMATVAMESRDFNAACVQAENALVRK